MDGRLIIANERLEASEKGISINPATGKPFGEFDLASASQCGQAVSAAREAAESWSQTSWNTRKRIFIKAKEILLSRREEAAQRITGEKGSPLLESMAEEILAGLEALDYYARAPRKTLANRSLRPHVFLFLYKKGAFHFQPQGPTLIISPWNYPFIIPICDILSALSAGNTVVLRPSSTTPFTALLIGEILLEAGLPEGVLNVVCCKTDQAEKMITHPDIRNIMFTGSTGIGKRVMELASRNLTNITLELGGKDPMIILKDADIDRAIHGAVWGAFTNCGQSCGSIERVYVAEEIREEFTAQVVALTESLKVGDPASGTVDVGPMTTEKQRETVRDHIQDAVSQGAEVLCGGNNMAGLPGYFIRPAVLSGVDHSMKIMTEETFGPVLPIMGFSDPEEAVALANDSPFGLTASIWTRSRKSAASLARRIEAGTVTINDHMYSFVEPGAIWGGIKQTGIGRSHGPFGQFHQVNIKYVGTDFSRKKRQIWWFPYQDSLLDIIDRAILLFHSHRYKTRLKSLFRLVPRLPRIFRDSPVVNYIKSIPRMIRK